MLTVGGFTMPEAIIEKSKKLNLKADFLKNFDPKYLYLGPSNYILTLFFQSDSRALDSEVQSFIH